MRRAQAKRRVGCCLVGGERVEEGEESGVVGDAEGEFGVERGGVSGFGVGEAAVSGGNIGFGHAVAVSSFRRQRERYGLDYPS